MLVASPTEIDLGEIRQGGAKEGYLSLVNPGDAPVEITKSEATCDCVTLRIAGKTIGPRQQISVPAKMDLSSEPDARGQLEVEVQGVTPNGSMAFHVVIKAKVQEGGENNGR